MAAEFFAVPLISQYSTLRPVTQIVVPESSVSRLIKEKIALFLLSLALERIKNHLLKEKPENDTTHPPETTSEKESPD